MRCATQQTVDVLRDLNSLAADQWVRPLDIGGRSNSHHSSTLRTLERNKLVESKQRSSWMSRGSKLYRITALGRTFLSKTQTELPLS